MDVACCVGGVGHGFSFAVWRKPALHIPTFDAPGCSAMKRKGNEEFADTLQREIAKPTRDESLQCEKIRSGGTSVLDEPARRSA
jgi:hypothetical protein